MKKLLASALAATVLSFGIGSEMTAVSAAEPQAVTKSNILTMAAVWKQTAAEYRALYYQGFNIAQKYVDEAVAKKKKKDKPLAVITDMDDTVVIHDSEDGEHVYIKETDKDAKKNNRIFLITTTV